MSITFLSASAVESYIESGVRKFGRNKDLYSSVVGTLPTDFVGMSYHIVDPISSSNNLIGNENYTIDANSQYINSTFISSVTKPEYIFNAIMLHRNGPYTYPTWKQVRNSEKPLVRYFNKNNIYSIFTPSPEEVNVKNGFRSIASGKNSGKIVNYIESPITIKYKPILHRVLSNDGQNEGIIELKYSHGNKLSTFANSEIVNKLGCKIEDKQIYDRILQTYTEEKNSPENQIKNFNSLIYKETIYPKETNAFLGRTRNRNDYYVSNFWNSERSDRTRYNNTNSQGYTVETSSVWP
jgi:hypothetical protein